MEKLPETNGAQANENPKIKLILMGQDNASIEFYINKTAPFIELIKYYSRQVGISPVYLKFRFDGQVVSGTDTPNSLQLEEGDTIEVYETQTGGIFNKIEC